MDKNRKKNQGSGMVESVSIGGRITNVVLGVLIAVVVFCSVVPMWHVVMSSLSQGREAFASDGLVLYPLGGINLQGYALLLGDSTILRSYLVTIMYVVLTAGLGLVLNVLGGYVLSQQSKLRGLFLAIMLFATMFSGGLIPSYMVNRALGLVGSPLGVIIPGCTNAMYVIMMMNAYRQVPLETVEAARMDGAGHMTVMFRIMLPQARGIALVTAVNCAIMMWNDWFSASIYLARSREWWPLQLVIKDLVSRNQDFLNFTNPDYNRYLIQYCTIVIATVPIFLLMPLFIRKLEENMTVGAVKG